MSRSRLALAVVAACALALVLTLVLAGGHGAQRSAHSPTFGLPPRGYHAQQRLTAVPSVEMLDTTSPSVIPVGARAVAGYTAGFWPTFNALVRLFPHAYHVSIAIAAGYVAQCLDIEPGDAVPSQARGWYVFAQAHGIRRPCFYANLSEMPAVKASLAGIARTSYRLWLALWTYRPGLVPGYDAVQWTDHGPHGENYDESTVTLAFLGVAPKPHPAPLPVCVHHRMSRSTCSILKAKVASDNRAAIASWRAWHRLDCPRYLRRHDGRWVGVGPYTQLGCSTLAQRAHYFTGRANSLEALA